MTNRNLEIAFQCLAGVLALAAIYFAWVGNFDRVFVLAALGSLSFFVSIRFQVKERLMRRAEELESREAHQISGASESEVEFENTTIEADNRKRI